MSLLDSLRATKKFEFQAPHSHEASLQLLRDWQAEEHDLAGRIFIGDKVPKVSVESSRSVKVFRLATARRGMRKILISADLELQPLDEDTTEISGSVSLSDYFLILLRNIFLPFIILWILLLCGGSSMDLSSSNVILGLAGFIALPFILSALLYGIVLYRRNSLLQAVKNRLQE